MLDLQWGKQFSEYDFPNLISAFLSLRYRYPYDNPTADNVGPMEDGLLFFEIAHAYASANPTMMAGKKCRGWKFGAGEVIGADLQVTRNTLQDYLYSQKNEFMVR